MIQAFNTFLVFILGSCISFSYAKRIEEMCASFPELPDYDDRIVAGNMADDGEYPYSGVVALQDLDSPVIYYSCAVSLISDRFVLTAANCLFEWNAVFVRFGDLSLMDDSENDGSVVDIGIDDIFIHPNSTRNPNSNDIALIKLHRSGDEEFLIPACLYTEPFDTLTSEPLTMIGWSSINLFNGVLIATDLTKVRVRTYDSDRCNSTLVKNIQTQKIQLENNEFCAFGSIGGKPDPNMTYIGSSGELIELSNCKRKYIVGLVSRKITNGSQVIIIYTRVSQFIDWIEKILTIWP